MGAPTLLDNYAAAVQAEMRKSVIQTKNQTTPTYASLKSGPGARNESGRLSGLEIPFYRGVVHGDTALDPLTGATSFERFNAPVADKMFVGLTFRGFTVEWEHFNEIDGQRGFQPETRMSNRDQAMRTYIQHQNWYKIGINTGSLAVVSVGGGSGSITFTNDGTARGRSKGSLRLAVSVSTTAGKRIMYQSYTESTDTLTATFYITAKSSSTTATVVVTDAGTLVAGDKIVKYGHYKRVSYGLGYFFNQTARLFQGANTTTDTQFNARRVDGGAALITPTAMDTAKGARQTRMNNAEAGKKGMCYLTMGNYKQLAAYSYNLRHYNAEKGQADTTFGIPNYFSDEDMDYCQDANFEDAYVYIANSRHSLFNYTQSELQEISQGKTQYVGTNLVGSTENYQNWGEAENLAWDARGEDGTNKDGAGGPFDGVVIDSLVIPANSQMAEGLSLV